MNRVAIFDVDGTLYDQKKLRMIMAIRLIVYYLMHISCISELKGIFYYRKLREKSEYKDLDDTKRIEMAACKAGCAFEDLSNAIDRWMYKNPLDLIKRFKNDKAIEYMKSLAKEGYKIAIYSDYPAEDKLVILGINVDFIFCPGKDAFFELKPSEKMMKYIVDKTDADTGNMIFVGDRDEKDGASARIIGAKYYDIKYL